MWIMKIILSFRQVSNSRNPPSMTASYICNVPKSSICYISLQPSSYSMGSKCPSLCPNIRLEHYFLHVIKHASCHSCVVVSPELQRSVVHCLVVLATFFFFNLKKYTLLCDLGMDILASYYKEMIIYIHTNVCAC